MNKFYIVKFDKDWADEFSVYGLALMTEAQVTDLKTSIENNKDVCIDVWFGTNEGWDGERVGDFLRDYTFEEISEQTFNELKTVFKYNFGHFINPVEYIDRT